MPYSSASGKTAITRFMQRVQNANSLIRVLDVGAGSGTYVDLFRKLNPEATWVGVEVWEPYVEQFKLKDKYDDLIVTDVRQLELLPHYSVIFLGDVLEHMTMGEATTLISKMITKSQYTIISIPLGYYPQDEYLGNPYEKHVKDDWTHEEMAAVLDKLGCVWVHELENEIGVYVIDGRTMDIEKIDHMLCDPYISAYGIFKNEEKFIERFITKADLADFDELVLCDTGSTDHTRSIIDEWEKTLWPGWLIVKDISVQPWRFDEARNVALSLTNPIADLCVSIDIDEYVEPSFVEQVCWHWRQEKADRYIHKFKTYWDPDDLSNISEHWHERIHARKGYRWSLPVHEILEKYDGPEKQAWLPDAWMFQAPDTSKNRGSYKALLEMSVKERPDIWKSWTFLAGEYITEGNFEAAKNAVREAMKQPNVDLAFCHYQLSFWGEDVIHHAQEAVRLSPIRELYVHLSNLQLNAGSIDESRALLRRAKEITIKTQGYMYNPERWDERFDVLLKERLND